MKLGLLVVVMAALPVWGQTGAELYRTKCAVAYCHGQNGAASKAPQLAGRGFTPASLSGVIRDGRPAAGMPSFAKQLSAEQIEAITRYLLSLSGPEHGTTPAASAAGQPKLSGEAEKGRALFFDAVRYGGCGRCHELNNRGVPIGPDLKGVSTANLRAGSSSRLRLASPVGEDPFAAIVVEDSAARVRVYDLTSKLPVLRSFRASEVKLGPGGVWSHAESNRDYTDAELESVGVFLKSLSRN